jgi:hypothetical protein
MRVLSKQLDNEFCWCGLLAVKKIAANYFCHKHKEPKVNKQTKPKFSVASKSEFAFGRY